MMETKAPENMHISYACTPNTLAETILERLFTVSLLQHMKTVRIELMRSLNRRVML